MLSGLGTAAPGRAKVLIDLSQTILSELHHTPNELPQSLSGRVTDWYDEIVVPVIKALFAERPQYHVVNLVGKDSIAREERVAICRGTITRDSRNESVSKLVASWIGGYEAHELATLDLLRDRSVQKLRDVVELDPLVPADRIKAVVRYFERQVPGRRFPGTVKRSKTT